MISAARRRSIRLVAANMEGAISADYASAYADALADTVRPIHIRSDGSSDGGANLGLGGGYVIFEGIGNDTIQLGNLNFQSTSNVTLIKADVASIAALNLSTGQPLLSPISITLSGKPTDRATVADINLASEASHFLSLNWIDSTVVDLSALPASAGVNGSPGQDYNGTNGVDGNDEEMYSAATNGTNGTNGGTGGDGNGGDGGYNGTGVGGRINAVSCNLSTVKIHGSFGGNGGEGGRGGNANGGNGGRGGDCYTITYPIPGDGGNGGDGGTAGGGGHGGRGGDGSPNINDPSAFTGCVINTLRVTALGGDGGVGGEGGSANGGIGGDGGVSFYDSNVFGNAGNNGVTMVTGNSGNNGNSGNSGASQTYNTDGSSITIVI